MALILVRSRLLPALLTLAFLLGPRAMRAQVVRRPDIPTTPPGQPSVERDWKDEHRARVLGTVLPGLGHVYAEEYSYGYSLFGLSVTGLFGGALVALVAPESENPSSAYAVSAGLGALGVGAWVWSAIDAPRAARRTNAKRITHRGTAFTPLIESAPGGGTRVGVSVTL
jgi:hypothetical protein